MDPRSLWTLMKSSEVRQDAVIEIDGVFFLLAGCAKQAEHFHSTRQKEGTALKQNRHGRIKK